MLNMFSPELKANFDNDEDESFKNQELRNFSLEIKWHHLDVLIFDKDGTESRYRIHEQARASSELSKFFS